MSNYYNKNRASEKKRKNYDDLTIFEQGKLHSLKGSLIETDMQNRMDRVDAKVALEKLKRKKAKERKKK